MAWSPFQRANAGIIGVEQPGDYANSIPTTSATGPARLLAKKQAIVSKLVAIEELAGVDVLCADKTGTLTQNKLTLGDPFCLDAVTADDLILAGALASEAANNDTIDLAVLGA